MVGPIDPWTAGLCLLYNPLSQFIKAGHPGVLFIVWMGCFGAGFSFFSSLATDLASVLNTSCISM